MPKPVRRKKKVVSKGSVKKKTPKKKLTKYVDYVTENVKCIACGGTGRSSSGRKCVPCNYSGFQLKS